MRHDLFEKNLFDRMLLAGRKDLSPKLIIFRKWSKIHRSSCTQWLAMTSMRSVTNLVKC